MGWRNLSKTAEKGSSSPRAAGVINPIFLLARQSHHTPRIVTVPVLLLVGIVRVHYLYGFQLFVKAFLAITSHFSTYRHFFVLLCPAILDFSFRALCKKASFA